MSTGAWTELAPAVAGSGAMARPCHPRGQAAGTLLREQMGTTGQESVGASQRPSMGHPQPLAPPARDTLAWAAEWAGCAHGFGFFSEGQYMTAVQIKALLS